MLLIMVTTMVSSNMEQKEELKKVFVYGTLKKGQYNHRVIGGATFIADTATVDSDYTMYHLGGYPGVVQNGGKDRIYGELYEVNDVIFNKLDGLEGYPDFYDRKIIKTEHGEAWIYIYNHANSEGGVAQRNIIEGGVWKVT